jgi:hypothetical protein
MSTKENQMLITYHIEVQPGGNAIVTADPNVTALKRGEENRLQFTTNDPTTVLKIGPTSPFAEAYLQPGKLIRLEKGVAGPFKAVNGHQSHRLDCGFINPANGEFSSWGGTTGVRIPDNDGGTG